jgi:anti-anti-sigma factor
MDIIEQAAGPVTIVEPRGRINSVTAREFGERLSCLIAGGRYRLVIDFQSVVYISSAGFRQLLIASKCIGENDGSLALCGINGEIKRLFSIGAFEDVFLICETRENGIAKVGERKRAGGRS